MCVAGQSDQKFSGDEGVIIIRGLKFKWRSSYLEMISLIFCIHPYKPVRINIYCTELEAEK